METLPPPDLALLSRFTQPDHPALKNVSVVHHYRGDCTESGDRRLRAMLGPTAYASVHFDTVACDGRVVIILPRVRLAGAVDALDIRFLTAEHHWALTQVDERSPEVTRATAATIQRVPVEIARRLHDLPELEFVDVANIHYWSHGRGPAKRKQKPAPADVVYFRFFGGYGVVAC